MFKQTIFLVIFLLVVSTFLAACTKEKPKVEKSKQLKYGVIDAAKVIKEHKDFERLDKLDKKIADIQSRMQFENPALYELGAKQAARMKEAQEQAKKELEAQLALVQKNMEQQKTDVARQISKEALTAKAQMEKLGVDRNAPAGSPTKVRELTNDLIILRDRQVAAKRLELQKAGKEKMDRYREKLENELAAYEKQISKENQQQRLNIQLKLQLEITDEEKKALTDELSAIMEEESRLKDSKKAEIGNLIEQQGKQELAEIEAAVTKYQNRVDGDIKKQVGLNAAAPEKQSELETKSRKIVGNFNEKQRALEAQLQGASYQSQRLLEEKQEQLQKRLSDLQKGMLKEMEQSKTQLAKADMERIAALQEELKNASEQRESLYNNMIEDIKLQAKKISETKGLDCIFFSYLVNIKGTDITEETIAAVKQKS